MRIIDIFLKETPQYPFEWSLVETVHRLEKYLAPHEITNTFRILQDKGYIRHCEPRPPHGAYFMWTKGSRKKLAAAP